MNLLSGGTCAGMVLNDLLGCVCSEVVIMPRFAL